RKRYSNAEHLPVFRQVFFRFQKRNISAAVNLHDSSGIQTRSLWRESRILRRLPQGFLHEAPAPRTVLPRRQFPDLFSRTGLTDPWKWLPEYDSVQYGVLSEEN